MYIENYKISLKKTSLQHTFYLQKHYRVLEYMQDLFHILYTSLAYNTPSW